MGAYIAKDKDINLLFAQTERVYRSLIEAVQVGIYMADAEGNLFFVNQAFVNILGYGSKDDLLGRNLAKELYLHPSDREIFMKSMEKTGFVKDYEVQNVRKDGTVVVLSVTSNFIRNDSGKVIGVEGVAQDITHKKQLEESLKAEKFKLEQILYFDEKISSLHRLDELADFVVYKVSEILGVGKCSLMMLDEKALDLCMKAAHGLPDEVIISTRLKLGEPVAGWVAQEGVPVLVANIEYDKRFFRLNKSSYLGKSFMSVPIKFNEKVTGVIDVADKDGQKVFNELDLKILIDIAREVGIAIENAKLYKELEYISGIDALTYQHNYRHFVKSLDYEIERLKRYQGNLSLLMLDIDNFKKINDAQGHLVGDEVLKKVGDVLRNNLRIMDTVCRYGGDEFVVILPETNMEHAASVAEKLRQKISEIVAAQNRVTVSIGVAEYREDLNRFDLTRRADRALYQAKQDGRNKVCRYDKLLMS